jgi:hypothetical protein
MALAFATTLRNARLDAIDDAINGGSGAGLLRIYDGTRPATGGSATTLLATLTFSDPALAAASSGTITASAITSDSAADATGTATWFRIVDSAGTHVMDGNVAASASDLNLTTTSILTGQPVSISSFVITEGNP